MPDLIAQGSEPDERWRRKLVPYADVVIGRACGGWSVPWDERISRRHIEVRLAEDQLEVHVLPDARNPVFYRGRKLLDFNLAAGESFVIGGTSFTFTNSQVEVSLQAPPPDNERTYSPAELKERPFRRTDERIDALARLPSIIHSSGSEEELLGGLVNVLLTGIPQATGVAVVALGSETSPIEVLQWDHPPRIAQTFAPSERLIRQARAQQRSVVHAWTSDATRSSSYTLNSGIDWAACMPLCSEEDADWNVYITGRFSDDAAHSADMLQDEMKFAELACATFRSLRTTQRLTRQQGALAQFLSPPVLQYIRGEDPEVVLAPREVDVSVLFCDLRGFSLESERLAGRLAELLERVSQSLGTMSRQILDSGGVVGDFHGDAAMGFWGWPLAMNDAPQRACRTALAIRREFIETNWQAHNQPADFRVGIGIATGRAVAGKIGTVDQVKVTVLGPVVNIAARLESITRVIRAPILIDGPTADALRASSAHPFARVRRIARIRPVGMSSIVDLHELLPTAEELPNLPTSLLVAYEQAWDAIAAGDWQLAAARLQEVPPQDRVRSFLESFLAALVRNYPDGPPADWEGVANL